MIKQQTRDDLKNYIKKGDYNIAALIYQKTTHRPITARYLQRFIDGEKNPSGRPGCHDPLRMFEAVAQAVHHRQQAEQQATKSAQQILTEKIRQQ